jgi:hypothetical protein
MGSHEFIVTAALQPLGFDVSRSILSKGTKLLGHAERVIVLNLVT